MKSLVLAFVAFLLLTNEGALAQEFGSVGVGSFEYVDLSIDAADEHAELTEFNEQEFSFLLNETLAMKTSLPMVDVEFADKRIIGRVTKLNQLGDARIEIAFITNETELDTIDGASDMVAVEAKLGDSDDAMIGLIDEVHHMVYLNVDPDARSNRMQHLVQR